MSATDLYLDVKEVSACTLEVGTLQRLDFHDGESIEAEFMAKSTLLYNFRSELTTETEQPNKVIYSVFCTKCRLICFLSASRLKIPTGTIEF